MDLPDPPADLLQARPSDAEPETPPEAAAPETAPETPPEVQTEPVDTPEVQTEPASTPDVETEPVATPDASAADDPPPVAAKPAPSPAPAPAPAPVPAHDYNADLTAATSEYQQAVDAKQKAEAAIEALADDDLPTAGQLKRLQTAQRAMETASQKCATARQQVEYQQRQSLQAAREQWAAENKDFTLTEADAIYAKIYASVAKEYAQEDQRTQQVVAGIKFSQHLTHIRDGRKANPPKAAKAPPPSTKPPVTAKGGNVLPLGAGAARPPAPKPMSVEDELLKKFGQPSKLLGV